MPVTSTRKAAAAMALCALMPACGLVGGDADRPHRASGTITVSSPAFLEGDAIPAKYTCEGPGISPPLSWTGVPTGAARLALVVDDPDAPGGTYVHWVVLNIDAAATGVAAGKVPAGGQQARNSTGEVGYAGPCPPSGSHHYRFTVYALRQPAPLPGGAALKDALADIAKRSITQGRLTGVFGKG